MEAFEHLYGAISQQTNRERLLTHFYILSFISSKIIFDEATAPCFFWNCQLLVPLTSCLVEQQAAFLVEVVLPVIFSSFSYYHHYQHQMAHFYLSSSISSTNSYVLAFGNPTFYWVNFIPSMRFQNLFFQMSPLSRPFCRRRSKH